MRSRIWPSPWTPNAHTNCRLNISHKEVWQSSRTQYGEDKILYFFPSCHPSPNPVFPVSINYTTQLLMPKNFDVVYFTLNIQAISKSCQLYLPHMLLWPLLSAFPTSTLLQVPSCLVWNNALASQLFPLLPALYPTVYSPHSSWVLRSLITNKSDQITPLGKTFHHLQITLGPGRCGPWLPLWPNFLPLFPPQGLHSSHTDLADP